MSVSEEERNAAKVVNEEGLNIRQQIEEREKLFLPNPASWSVNTRGRDVPEEESDMRTCYMRDRDRILHCKSFRRMKHKTQVFLAPEGDHYRTRLTHTLEVSQIARTIGRALRLNEDLIEAIALGHDIGHTPFGHAGERVLNELSDPYHFSHYSQGIRIVEKLENGHGLNLTWEVRDGIRNHSLKGTPNTEEGKVVRFADKIAYINHDIDDAVRGHVLTEDDLPLEPRKVLGFTFRDRINFLVHDVISTSLQNGTVSMSDECYHAMNDLRSAMFDEVYIGSEAKREEKKAEEMIGQMYQRMYKEPERWLPASELEKWHEGKEPLQVLVCDYIASMSDNFAMHVFSSMYMPKGWNVY